jgi:hypothetical protein
MFDVISMNELSVIRIRLFATLLPGAPDCGEYSVQPPYGAPPPSR